ncbi:MAG: helix-turn-helix domain-containing protein [Hormoscilla sp. GM102CHS1]|nr:helix-turn-helix domain-containing protein [Hormoscilla sp. GM102CHS1]
MTIYNWFDAWEEFQIVGLYDRKGRGRKPKFNSEQIEQIVVWTKEFPKQIKLVKEKIKQEWDVEVSNDTIKRILKNANMSADQKTSSWGTRTHRISRKKGGIKKIKTARRSR